MRGLRPLPILAMAATTVLALYGVALLEQGRWLAGVAVGVAAVGLAAAVGRTLAFRALERRARAAERERAFAAGWRRR
jgi:hypothetical protein